MITSLWQISDRWSSHLPGRISDGSADLSLTALLEQTRFGGQLERLRGQSILLVPSNQLDAISALVELDGVARRMIICPPDATKEFLIAAADIGAADIVIGRGDHADGYASPLQQYELLKPERINRKVERSQATEWVLPTSGTSGPPKLVVHTIATLCGAFPRQGADLERLDWATFYDIRRFGGLQILLRTLVGGGNLLLAAEQPTGQFLSRAGELGVTHISGTPSHWRRALMTGELQKIAPRYVRLSGEVADQAVLDSLAGTFPSATIAHAFASTEVGVTFEVGDGVSGFPADLVGRTGSDVELEVMDGSLHVRSNRTALRYLGGDKPLKDDRGFIDTGDLVELRIGRYQFLGRRNGVINVGGLKVHPEEVEAIINRHPAVQLSRVTAKRNPITGAIVVAQILARTGDNSIDLHAVESEVVTICRRALPPHKVPVKIEFVQSLEMGASGKLVRNHV